MPEQKIVQHRRDIYSNYAPSKLKPGEIAMVTSGDPNSSSGKAVYACVAAGDVLRLATQDELGSYDLAAAASATAAAQSKTDAAAIKLQVDGELASAQSAAQGAADAQTAAQGAAATATAAITTVQGALSAVNDKAAEIAGITASVPKTETGSATTNAIGEVYVYLSGDFRDALGQNGAYRVFLQEEGEGKLYVSSRTNAYFVVSGTGSLAFSWLAII